jgi:hypothetical protein
MDLIPNTTETKFDRTHPYRIHFERDHYPFVHDMIQWCFAEFGEGGYIGSVYRTERWAVVTAFGKSSWLFKNQEDATMFALRWA